jgi:hypothetical protein
MFYSCESCERAWQKGFYIVMETQSNGEVYIPPHQVVIIEIYNCGIHLRGNFIFREICIDYSSVFNSESFLLISNTAPVLSIHGKRSSTEDHFPDVGIFLLVK